MNTIENVVERAVASAKKAMGVKANILDLPGRDLDSVTNVIVELIRWDAARMSAEAVKSRRKSTHPSARS